MKDCVELTSATSPGETLTAYSEGGGDPNSILFRVRHPSKVVIGANTRIQHEEEAKDLDVVVDEDEVRMLFNWLGAWLHTRRS